MNWQRLACDWPPDAGQGGVEWSEYEATFVQVCLEEHGAQDEGDIWESA